MSRHVAFCALPILLLTLVASSASATQVTFTPSTLTFQQNGAAQSVGILVTGLPTGTQLGFASFYLKWDTTALNVSNIAWDTSVLDTPGINTNEADGINISAANIAASGTPSGTTALVTFDVQPAASTTGDYSISFNTSSELNVLQDLSGQPLDVSSWATLPVTITTGPPNPGQVTGVTFGANPTKDPAVINLAWSTGIAQSIEMQYSTDGTTWNDPASGSAVADVANKKITWTSPYAGKMQQVHIRARAIDQNKVWDGSAIVDAGPNAGWVEASSVLTIDNKPPTLLSATAASDQVTLTFDEAIKSSTAVAGNFAVNQTGGGAIAINSVAMSGDKAVVLTLASAPVQTNQYTASANNIQDLLGNLAESQQVDVSFKPKLVSAALVRDGANNKVAVTFSNVMANAAPMTTAASWALKQGSTAVAISNVSLSGDGKTATVTAGTALAQNTTYTVTAPAAAADNTGKQLGTDNTADFTTPFWHVFGAGLLSVGVPLDVTSRALTALGADAIAAYDPSLNSGAGGYVVDSSQSGSTVIDLGPGLGFFSKWAAAHTAYFGGAANSSDVTVPVKAGWNLVSNPFMTNINIGNLKAGDTGLKYAWAWDGTQYQLVASLPSQTGLAVTADPTVRPWVGYFVNAAAAGNLTISPSVSGVAQPLAIGGKGSVLIQLVAKAGDALDAVNVCGVGPTATTVDNPPFAAGSVDLSFVGKDAQPLAVDVTTGSVTQSWDAVLKTDLPNTRVTISAPDLSSVPSNYTVVLTDQATGQKTYLRTSSGYTFTTGANGADRKLTVSIVQRAQTTMVTAVSIEQAGAGRVVVTYGLNGPASISARVLNIAGRVIKNVAADQAQTAGTHTLGWDLTNTAGSAVPRGTYLLTITARTEDGQQVTATRTFAVNR